MLNIANMQRQNPMDIKIRLNTNNKRQYIHLVSKHMPTNSRNWTQLKFYVNGYD